MSADHLPDDGKAETEAATARSIGAAIEPLEDAGLILGADPNPAILDLDHRPRPVGPDPDRDVRHPLGVLHGVVEQVDDHLLDGGGIRVDEGAAVR